MTEPRSDEAIRADLAVMDEAESWSDRYHDALVRVLHDAGPLVADRARLQRENSDLRKRLGAALCPVSWPSGTHSPPHQCAEPVHHLTRHLCACGVKG